MKLSALHLIPCLGLITCLQGQAKLQAIPNTNNQPRETKLFNDNWRFARFGTMPDGSKKSEPWKEHWQFTVSADSAEDHNPPQNAFDNNISTRWCAKNGQPNHYITIDLQKNNHLKKIDIVWEKENAAYHAKIEGSLDGSTWSEISFPANTRFIRITATKLPNGNWASIKEIKLIDQNDQLIENKAVPSSTITPASPKFQDQTWRPLNLPHDWGIEGPFRMDLPNESGKLPWAGIAWYRKNFTLASNDIANKQIFLEFDGAMAQPKVFINDQFAGEWKFGYNSFQIDITPFVKKGSNTVAVRLENLPDSTRWYPGGGIYRNVRMIITAPTYVNHWGTFITTPEVNKEQATVKIDTTIKNKNKIAKESTILQQIFNNGKIIAETKENISVESNQSSTITSKITVKNPILWDVDNPHLYTLVTSIIQNNVVIDRVSNTFGIRTIKWDVEQGFILNGRKVYLKGVCQHHDLGALGSAVNYRATERQVQILKEMGCNSIRTSHNPPSPELLEICDKMGILVIDELFDVWKLVKYGKANCYNIFWDDWHEKDVQNFIMRDRNHPCVIAWSLGNEIAELGNVKFHWVPEKLNKTIKLYDTTRPTTAGSNDPSASRNGFANHIDVYGGNYHIGSYGNIVKNLPNKPLYASETASCVASRGEYFFNDNRKEGPVSWDKNGGFYNFHVSSYALYSPGWANRPDLQFEVLEKNPRFAGEYVWTGFDYIGEPTPYNLDSTNALNFKDPEERKKAMGELKKLGNRAPCRSSYFGLVDLAGFPKDVYYLYQSQWRPNLPMVHILPHWNWPERVGKLTPVHVFTSGDECELFLNGKSLGRKKRGLYEYRFHWDDVKYEAGTLKAIAYKNNKKWAENSVSTTGDAAKLSLKADRSKITNDGLDLAFITLKICDKKDQVVPRTKNEITFSIEGPGEIVATDNGDPTDHTLFQSHQRKAFNGLALVIVKAKPNQKGKITVKATANNLTSAIETIELITK